mgnify:CR=1 FL=1
MAKNAQPPEGGATPASFEQAMQELERVVAEMESGELSLEAALDRKSTRLNSSHT